VLCHPRSLSLFYELFSRQPTIVIKIKRVNIYKQVNLVMCSIFFISKLRATWSSSAAWLVYTSYFSFLVFYSYFFHCILLKTNKNRPHSEDDDDDDDQLSKSNSSTARRAKPQCPSSVFRPPPPPPLPATAEEVSRTTPPVSATSSHLSPPRRTVLVKKRSHTSFNLSAMFYFVFVFHFLVPSGNGFTLITTSTFLFYFIVRLLPS